MTKPFKMKGWSPFTKKDDDFTPMGEMSRIIWKDTKKHVGAVKDIKKEEERRSKKKRIMTDARLRLKSYKNIGKIIEKKLTK